MKIWLINHYAVPTKYYPLARPASFAKELKREGHEVTIIAASSVHNSNLNLIEDNCSYKKIEEEGIPYVLIKCKNYNGNGLSRILNMNEFARNLPKVCDELEKPDAIVATSLTPMACAKGIKLGKKYGCKVVAEIADLWPESLIAYGIAGKHNPFVLYLRRLEKWIYKNASSIVFTIEGAYDYIKEQKWTKAVPESKVHYINNGIDLEKFIYNRDNYITEDSDLIDDEIFKVIYCGSIRKVNNLGLLLDVAKEVKNEKVKFLIWGGGDELENLQKRVLEESIKNVEFKGMVEKKYVPYIVSKADLNIAHNIPSPLFKYGISFNKLFDYLAAEKPVLSDFPCKYNPAVMSGAGTDVNVPTPKNIANEIERYVSLNKEKNNEYCKNAKQAAVRYDFKNLTKELLRVIIQ